MHTAIDMAKRNVARQLPADLVWPFNCERRCGELVSVATGPVVADELTRNLRGPHREHVRGQWS